MKKEQFEKLKAELLERGYRIYDQHWHHEDYVIGKGFHKADNQWEEDRAAYQIIISVYDWTDESKEIYDRLPSDMRNRVGLEIHIDVSRTTDERIDMTISWHDKDLIEDVEWIAEEFYRWVKTIYPEPREES